MKRDKAPIRLGTNEDVSVHATRRELLSLRDVADTLFRQSRVILALCAIFTLAMTAYFWFSPRMYEAEMTILVKNTRADLIVTPDGRTTAMAQPEINDTQMATEIQLLSSADLFRKVVDRCDLGGMTPASHEKATAKLQKKVRIAPGDYAPDLMAPQGPSTAGGVQAMQHLRLVPGPDVPLVSRCTANSIAYPLTANCKFE